MSLTARYLEANGIPTVVMGCAKDIVEHAGVPRFLFSDFPLGNAAGRPHDPECQRETLALALDLLESATHARTTLQNPQHWDDNGLWKLDFQNVDQIPAEEIARRRAEFDEVKRVAKERREQDGSGKAAAAE